MRRILNKWQIVWEFHPEYQYDRWGWRQVASTRPGRMPGMAVMLLELPELG